MKHILPILTLALLGAAVTASAQDTKAFDNFYYDYYLNPGISGVSTDPVSGRETDTVSYRDFAVTRFSQADNNLLSADGSNNANLYKITITGGDADGKTQVKLYLTDFVKNLAGGNSNALYNNVAQYGYRILNPDGSVEKVEDYFAMPDNPDELEAIDGGRLNAHNDPVYRYQYELGTFKQGTELEIYMKHRYSGNSAYSYNDLAKSALGGYGDGGYYPSLDEDENRITDENGKIVTSIVEETDGLLDLYHFNETLDSEHYGEYTTFDSDRTVAAQKAMPLAGLDISYNQTRVYFGIIGETVIVGGTSGGGASTFGRPLPGGLQIALIAGLFGLGFCYVRRRKAIVA